MFDVGAQSRVSWLVQRLAHEGHETAEVGGECTAKNIGARQHKHLDPEKHHGLVCLQAVVGFGKARFFVGLIQSSASAGQWWVDLAVW